MNIPRVMVCAHARRAEEVGNSCHGMMILWVNVEIEMDDVPVVVERKAKGMDVAEMCLSGSEECLMTGTRGDDRCN